MNSNQMPVVGISQDSGHGALVHLVLAIYCSPSDQKVTRNETALFGNLSWMFDALSSEFQAERTEIGINVVTC